MEINQTYLKMLYEAEKSIIGVNELTEIETKVRPAYEKCKKDLENTKGSKKGCLLILIGVTIAFFFLSAGSINHAVVLRNLCRILLVVSAIATVAVLSEVITAPGKIKRAQEALAKAEADLAAYEKLFAERTADLVIGIKLWKTMMPEECINPVYARKYISFFEHGQATTEAEARNLFDMFLHREEMEKIGKQQLAAIQAGNAAVVAAANRAADAANAAASATRDLNQTANYIRSK